MTESAEEILRSVESELRDAEQSENEQLENQQRDELARGESGTTTASSDYGRKEYLDNSQESAASDHDSSAAVLEISHGDEEHRDAMSTTPDPVDSKAGMTDTATTAARANAAPASLAEPSRLRQQQPMRQRAATLPGASASQSRNQSGDGLSLVSPQREQPVGGQPTLTDRVLSTMKVKWKVTRQTITEQLVPTMRTTDPKLSDRIERLLVQRDKYSGLLKVALRLCAQVRDIKGTQRELAGVLGTFTVRSEVLGRELEVNTNTQRQLARNGDVLYQALSMFCATLTHLLSTTMEDTFAQLKAYQAARLEYDAYRNDEAQARTRHEQTPDDPHRAQRLQRKVQELAERKQRFETLRKDLTVRVHFLEQNQQVVMTRQLTLLHNASCAYFTGNSAELEKCIRQFSIKMPQNLGQDSAGAVSSGKLEPLPFPTPSELGTPSEALSALLVQQLTDNPTTTITSNGEDAT